MQKGNISVESENIFPVIKKFLYSDNEIFLRELVSNAVDATSKLQALAAAGKTQGELGDLTIEIKLDTKKKQLIISDKGIGMTADEVERYINNIAFSGANEFLEKYKGVDVNSLIGHFGLGFYSAFMVADKVEILSKSYQPEAKAVRWTCSGSTEYTLKEDKRKVEDRYPYFIFLTMQKNFGKLVFKSSEKYAKFLPVPIRFRNEKNGKNPKEKKRKRN